jgi:hypothetical protein
MGTYLKIIPGSPQNLTLSVYPYLTPVKTTDFTIRIRQILSVNTNVT